jgi:hypothetical protein
VALARMPPLDRDLLQDIVAIARCAWMPAIERRVDRPACPGDRRDLRRSARSQQDSRRRRAASAWGGPDVV